MMTTWLRMGARNLRKNQRRSLFTICAVAIGYSAIALFTGFVVYVFLFLQEGFVHAYANGHLAVFQQGPARFNAYAPTEELMERETLETVMRICLDDERVMVVTPQLFVRGLVSNGKQSTVFAGLGRVPEDVERIQRQARTHLRALTLFEGRPLMTGAQGIGVSTGIAASLGLASADPILLVATTWDGHMNALDAELWQVMDAPSDILQDLLLDLPLGMAQSLYDTKGADRLIIVLREPRDTLDVKRDLQAAFLQAGLDLDVRPWMHLFPSYDRLRKMFTVVFVFVYGIVLVIVALSIINTVSMSVLERTREIGAMRALGLRQRGVLVMFAFESALLGFMGSLVGLLFAQLAWGAIRWSGLQWQPPVVMFTVPLELHLRPQHLVLNIVLMTVLAACAAWLPAHRAAHVKVVDALGHV